LSNSSLADFQRQNVYEMGSSLLETNQPFSSAESTGAWLEEHALLSKPLVFAPDHDASVILAEKGIKTAYFASCSCEGSFVVFSNRRSEERQITAGEIQNVWAKHGESPIVLTHWKLQPEALEHVHMALLYTSRRGFFWPYEDLYVYSDTSGPRNDVATARP